MRRALRYTCLPLAVLAMVAAAPTPLLSPVPSADGNKLREQRWWVKVTTIDGASLEGILLNYRSKTGEFTVAPDEKDLLKHRQIPQARVRSVELLKAYVPKPDDPAADAWTEVKKNLSAEWQKTLAKVLEAKDKGELDALIRETEERLKSLRIGRGGIRAARAAHGVMRTEIMKLLFAYCEQAGKTDRQAVLGAVERLKKLSSGMSDRWVRNMYLRRVDALRRSIEASGSLPAPKPGRDWGRRH